MDPTCGIWHGSGTRLPAHVSDRRAWSGEERLCPEQQQIIPCSGRNDARTYIRKTGTTATASSILFGNRHHRRQQKNRLPVSPCPSTNSLGPTTRNHGREPPTTRGFVKDLSSALFRRWCLKIVPELQTHHLYIVSWTHHASRCFSASFRGLSPHITPGFPSRQCANTHGDRCVELHRSHRYDWSFRLVWTAGVVS